MVYSIFIIFKFNFGLIFPAGGEIKCGNLFERFNPRVANESETLIKSDMACDCVRFIITICWRAGVKWLRMITLHGLNEFPIRRKMIEHAVNIFSTRIIYKFCSKN